MKQNITVEQLSELSDKGKKRLRGWWKPEKGDITDEGIVLEVKNARVNTWLLITDDWTGSDFSDYAMGCEKYQKDKTLPLLSIGQMIEFLHEQEYGNAGWGIRSNHTEWWLFSVLYGGEGELDDMENPELCDALWSAVKEVLEIDKSQT